MQRGEQGGKRPYAQVAVVVAFVAVTVAIGVRYGAAIEHFFSDPTRIRTSFERLGAWGPVVSVLLSAAQVLVAPLPGQAVGLANGYLYGPYVGLALSMVGMAIGSAMAMGLARWLGRPIVEHFIDASTLDRLDRFTAHRGASFFFLIFLVPFLPDDAACFMVGLSSLPIGRMLVLALLGRAPGTFVACFVGAHAESLPMPAMVAIFAVVLLLGIGFARYSSALEAKALETIERVDAKLEPQPPDEDAGRNESET